MTCEYPRQESLVPVLPMLMHETDLAKRLRELDFHILGMIRYEQNKRTVAHADYLAFSLSMRQLGNSPLVEVWASPEPLVYGEVGAIGYASNRHVLFGGLHLPKLEYGDVGAYIAYQAIQELIRTSGHPHLLRIWNYFLGINDGFMGLERYQHFCFGRHQAFVEYGYNFDGDLPAASAIGVQGDGLWVHFLAARKPGLHVENPRQISAYHYPLQYGPRSPSFSRATLASYAGEDQFYISGTSSIAGHQTLHRDDLAAQLRETLINIRSLLEQPALSSKLPLKDLDETSQLKVYIRRPEDFGLIKGLLEESVGRDCPILFLQGDICRHDLLLEIEGIIRFRR